MQTVLQQSNKKPAGHCWHRSLMWVSLASALSTLVACGGGGGDSTSGGATPGAGAPGQAGTTPGSVDESQLDAQQKEILQLVNAERAQGATCGNEVKAAAGPLQWNSLAQAAALGHSQYMQTAESVSHTGANGSSAGMRLTAAGYTWSLVGENIAAGQPTATQVMQEWMGSAGHCANIMNAGFKDVAVVMVPGTGSNIYTTYWTMVLGTSR